MHSKIANEVSGPSFFGVNENNKNTLKLIRGHTKLTARVLTSFNYCPLLQVHCTNTFRECHTI